MKELVALVCSAANMSMRIEDVTESLWPGCDKAKARNKLDVLLLRFRAALRTAFGDVV